MLWGVSAMAQDKQLGTFTPRTAPAEAEGISGNGLSPTASMLMADLQQLGRRVRKKDETLIKRYGLLRQGCRYYVQATIEPSEGCSDKAMKAYGIRTNSRSGNCMTALVPTHRYAAFVNAGLARRIDVSAPVEPKKKHQIIDKHTYPSEQDTLLGSDAT